MAGNADLALRALERIKRCDDPIELRRIAENARALGNINVRETALLKLYDVSPAEKKGTLEHDVWRSIFALEGSLSDERGKTIRLSRTRQKIARDGEIRTVADLVSKPPSEGFRMLLDRGWLNLTFEAVALRHSDNFDRVILTAAADRLKELGIRSQRTVKSPNLPNHPSPFRPAGQVEQLASVTAIGVQGVVSALGDLQGFGLGRVARLFAADT